MRVYPFVFLFVLFLSPISLAQDTYSISFFEGSDLGIILESGEVLNPLDYDTSIFLCDKNCNELKIDSISFSEDEIEFFVSPEEGFYELKIIMEGKERLEFSEEVMINRTYTKEKNKNENPGITGNIMKSSSSPLFLAGVFGFLSLILLCSIKTKKQINLKRWDLKVSSYKIKGSMVFLLSLLVLSQFTHELFHIFTASIFSCKAVLNSFIPVISPASVALECSASAAKSIIILGSGIMGNIIIGLFFQLFYKKTGKKIFSILSVSFLASSFLYFFYRTGDIHSIMRIMGTGINQIYLDFVGFSLIGVVFYFFFTEHIQNIGTNPKYHNDM